MHIRRLALIAGWAVMSLFTAAGFAAFGGGDVTSTTGKDVPLDPSLGKRVGAVVALAFSHDSEPSATSPPPDDPVINDISANSVVGPGSTTVATAQDDLGRVLTEGQLRGLVSKYFKKADVERALRIAWCESKYDTEATNPRSGAAGLFQHLPKYWGQRSDAAGWEGASIYDPEANVAVAAWLRDEFGGWSHWTCR